ncbi:MAG: HAD family hydrolase [Legionellales bacterium]|nr:HAD family hydrolase [Legionellales bacterium]
MSQAREHKAVIFDMDGLLLDTENLYMQASQEILGQYGKTFDWDLKEKIMGRPSTESAKVVVETLGVPLAPSDYLKIRQERLNLLFQNAAAMPGAIALCQLLQSNEIPHALATSSNRQLFELKTRPHQHWFQGFTTIVTGDDPMIKRGKPSPDIFLLAAERLGIAPQHCIAFEDSPAGVTAAVEAGMTVIAVPDPRLNRSLIQSAHEIIETLEQFSPEKWRLTNSLSKH